MLCTYSVGSAIGKHWLTDHKRKLKEKAQASFENGRAIGQQEFKQVPLVDNTFLHHQELQKRMDLTATQVLKGTGISNRSFEKVSHIASLEPRDQAEKRAQSSGEMFLRLK